jgi:hypothetical protein
LWLSKGVSCVNITESGGVDNCTDGGVRDVLNPPAPLRCIGEVEVEPQSFLTLALGEQLSALFSGDSLERRQSVVRAGVSSAAECSLYLALTHVTRWTPAA